MENMSIDTMNDGKNEEKTILCNIENLELKEGGSLLSEKCTRRLEPEQNLTRRLEPEQNLILDVRRSRICATHWDFFFQNIHGLQSSIPKNITSFDEKYALRCLELIRNFAIRASAWNFTSKVDVLSGDMNQLTEIRSRSSYEIPRLAIECPLAFGTEVIVNSTGEWTIGTVTHSQSMINILNSPLLQQFGSLDSDLNFGRTSLLDVGEVYSYFMDSPHGLSSKSSDKLQKKATVLDYKHSSAPMHNRVVSVSSTISSSSDQSSSSISAAMYQGMLQSTWKDGLPHYVFTMDDTRDVYLANSSKVQSLDPKLLDYVYTFHSRKNGKKECDSCEHALEIVGKMRVSNSITVCSDNSEVLETRFVLSVSNSNHPVETQTSNHTLKKNKRLTKKMVNVFRSYHSYKQRSSSKFEGSSTIFEESSSNPSEDAHNSLDAGEVSAENKCMQNFESAAIIVKDRILKKADLGGWGMKFLNKSGNRTSLEALTPSKYNTQKSMERSMAIDILIPAGFHGGPRTRSGGPSSLIERWISGGSCDCGGWDTGCPLTILNTKSSSRDSSSLADNSEECKSINLFVQGSKQNVPIMKMVNIHDDLYYIHFQSTLSILQSFAIAAAILHSRSPVLQSNSYRT